MGIQNASEENIYYTLGKTKTIELQNQSSIKQWRIQKEGTIDLLGSKNNRPKNLHQRSRTDSRRWILQHTNKDEKNISLLQ